MLTFKTLDEAYVYYATMLKDAPSCAPRGLKIRELIGEGFELLDIRNRIIYSRERNSSLFFNIGEFLWYIRGSNKLDIIQYYSKMYPKFSDDQKTLYGAYGKRIFSAESCRESSWNSIIELLRKDPDSRQAVISIHEPRDVYSQSKDIPCTCLLQFLIRNNHLYCITYMRSNDLFLGFPYDIFSFTMLQEMLANELGVEVGTYKHFVGSLHVYEKHYQSICESCSKSVYESKPMEKMPYLDTEQMQKLLDLEEKIRLHKPYEKEQIEKLNPYWRQIVFILIHKAAKMWGTEIPTDSFFALDECYKIKIEK